MATSAFHWRFDTACAGAGVTAAAALPAGSELQNFWYELAAAEQLSKVGSAHFLQLGNGACFPLEGNAVRGRLLVRHCYEELSQILQQHCGWKVTPSSSPGVQVISFIMVSRELSYKETCT